MKQYKKDNCRYCNSKLSSPFLELGGMALANSFLHKDQLNDPEFTCPLNLVRCNQCGLVQLSHVVPAYLMFSNYLYVSSTTSTFRKHFADYAAAVKKKIGDSDQALAVDIGSNDGLLVSSFIKEGMRAIGVDPAENLVQVANRNGIPTICGYFNHQSVSDILKKYGKADIITANNVFAHIDDSQSVCENAYRLLSDNGVWIIEFPYLITMLDEMLFDMIYHEHLSYISLVPLQFLLTKFEMEIFDVEKVPVHGGSLRVFIQKKGVLRNVSQKVKDLLSIEKLPRYSSPESFDEFANKVLSIRTKLVQLVEKIKRERKSVCGYGAPAKGNTLISFCNFTTETIDYIVDDNPLKQNTFTPGTRIPVVPSSCLQEKSADYIIIFAWNFANEIINKLSFLKSRNVKFIIPLPEPRIL